FEVAHQHDRVAHPGADVAALAAHRREPFHLPRLQVEEVDDRARHAEQLAQRPQRRLGDRGRRAGVQHAAVHLVQELQALRVALERLFDRSHSVKEKVAPAPGSDSAQMRPPWRATMRCAMARPTPVPGKSSARCSLWNTPKSRSAYFMSKPAPLSRTKYTRSGPSRRAPISTRASARLLLYLNALLTRFTHTWRMSAASARASGSSPITTSVECPCAAHSASTWRTSAAMSTLCFASGWRPRRDISSRSSMSAPIFFTESPITCKWRRPASPSIAAQSSCSICA